MSTVNGVSITRKPPHPQSQNYTVIFSKLKMVFSLSWLKVKVLLVWEFSKRILRPHFSFCFIPVNIFSWFLHRQSECYDRDFYFIFILKCSCYLLEIENFMIWKNIRVYCFLQKLLMLILFYNYCYLQASKTRGWSLNSRKIHAVNLYSTHKFIK